MEKIDELVKRISENSDYSQEEIDKMIKEKEAEFSGLISTEGAAHIVAKEAGVNLLEKRDVKIADIVPEMNNVNVVGKVLKKFEPKEFEKKDGNKGAVANIMIADETGKIRMSLWDEQINTLEELDEGDVMQVLNGYTKEGYQGNAELRVGKRGMLKKVDKKIEVTETAGPSRESSRMNIKDCGIGDNAEFRAALVQVFENNPFFVKKDEEGKEEKPRLVMNGVIDDGTGNIRLVMFAETIEKALGTTTDELLKESNNGINPKIVTERYRELLGKELIFKGYIKMNNFFERPEFIANDVREVDPQKEAKEIIGE